jgi:hypothetical protein
MVESRPPLSVAESRQKGNQNYGLPRRTFRFGDGRPLRIAHSLAIAEDVTVSHASVSGGVDPKKHAGAVRTKPRPTIRRDFRELAIAHYHELLGADKMLSAAVFEKLHATMRGNRLLYGERPIGIALRPHFLERKLFEALVDRAELVASALEKVASAAVQSPALMTRLGLTEIEQRLARIEPGFSGSTVTSRMDGFVYGNEIKFVEYNAENPSSLSDQEGLNRLLFELPTMSIFAKQYQLQQFSPADKLLETLLATYREWGGTRLPKIAILDWNTMEANCAAASSMSILSTSG